MIAFLLIAYFVTGALVVMLIIAVFNAWRFPRLAAGNLNPEARVSLLIPARNEAGIIGSSLRMLQKQDDPGLEILVLDDNSTDDTAEAVRAAAEEDGRIRLLIGAPLPPGRLGKPWACHQLSRAATGDILIFTDADVGWQPRSINAVVQIMNASGADLLSVWPTQITRSWAERLTVPLMALAVLAYLPLPMVRNNRMRQAAAANGQCMAFRREAYDACGGHAAVAGRIVEDIALAEAIKGAGRALRLADGNGLITCRMYCNWSEVLHGYTKNILAGHRNSFLLLGLSTAFHLLIFLGPWLWLGLGWALPWPGRPLWPLILVILGVTVRGITAWATGQRIGDASFMPLSALLMTVIAGNAAWQQLRYGGARWKGRIVSERASAQQAAAIREETPYGS
ncbi:MAG: glycosyltransferase [Caldilineaceae bacterium]|nr:glycosyltransferase [Caldilineaceae bacterium]